jgi:hypothetical protein
MHAPRTGKDPRRCGDPNYIVFSPKRPGWDVGIRQREPRENSQGFFGRVAFGFGPDMVPAAFQSCAALAGCLDW